MATDDMPNPVTLPPPTTDYFEESLPQTTPRFSSARESPSESSTIGAMREVAAYADTPASFEKQTPISSINSSSDMNKSANITIEDHPIKEIEGKGKGNESVKEIEKGTGDQETDHAKIQAERKQKEQEKTDAWVKNFDAAQQGGRSLSVLDPEWTDLQVQFQEDMEKRAKYLKEHPKAAPVEKKRKRDFAKRLLMKVA